MVFHVGVNRYICHVYDDVKKEISEFSLKERFDDANAIDLFYEEIKSRVKGEFGYICFSLFQVSNEFRKIIVSSGLACGFKKIQILDSVSNIYIYSVFRSKYKPNNEDVIWIFNGDRCHVWKKINDSAQFFGEVITDFIEKKDLEKMMEKFNKHPDIILSNMKFEGISGRFCTACKNSCLQFPTEF